VLRGLLILVLVACLAPVVGFWGSSLHWSFDLASQFLLPVVVVACAVAIIAGFARWSGIGASALAIAVVASVNAGPWTSHPLAEVSSNTKFSVLLFNVWYRNQDIAGIEKRIREKNPDLVVLLEATPRIRDGLKSIIQSYPYHVDCLDVSRCGILVLSRSRLSPQRVSADGVASMVMKTNFAGCDATLVMAHLTRPYPFDETTAQKEQAIAIASEAAAWPGAKLVVGDFNAAPWGSIVKTIVSRGKLSVLTGPGGTWPAYLPKQMRIPIDHMFAGPGLRFVKREVLGAAGSDHAPVFAEVVVSEPSKCGQN
jgi:endonuclease/exonuclease/phosphatase (EEP) superfamily protein YafD